MRRRDGNKRRRVERQDEAKARQASYDALTITQKIVRAKTRLDLPKRTSRELVRLYRHLDAEGIEPIGGVRLA